MTEGHHKRYDRGIVRSDIWRSALSAAEKFQEMPRRVRGVFTYFECEMLNGQAFCIECSAMNEVFLIPKCLAKPIYKIE